MLLTLEGRTPDAATIGPPWRSVPWRALLRHAGLSVAKTLTSAATMAPSATSLRQADAQRGEGGKFPGAGALDRGRAAADDVATPPLGQFLPHALELEIQKAITLQ